jgi:predicted RNA binding protein YcfA (HicA-like mRNA interferase family)
MPAQSAYALRMAAMAKLPRVSSEKVIRPLVRAGFEANRKRGKGSHTLMVRREPELVVFTVPDRKEMPKGTLRAILRQAGLSVDQFVDLMSD